MKTEHQNIADQICWKLQQNDVENVSQKQSSINLSSKCLLIRFVFVAFEWNYGNTKLINLILKKKIWNFLFN